MQAPRTLWDTSYVTPHETYPDGGSSWVNKWWNAPFLPVLTRFKADIQNYNPDTNIAITEYTYGPSSQWATGITTADFLGICGKYGVYITNYWGQGGYIDTAIKIYRNYDGFHSTYGDTNVPATMSDKVNSSVYASINDSNNFPLHIIVLNKNQDNAINGTFNITSSHSFSSGRVFTFDATDYDIREITPISNITGNSFTYTIPKTSVCHIVLDGPPCQLLYDITGDCRVNILDLDILVNQWIGGDCSADPNCADFNGDLNVDFTDFSLFSQEWRIN
jgi:mannan endo-1,4-beta-mannosidase